MKTEIGIKQSLVEHIVGMMAYDKIDIDTIKGKFEQNFFHSFEWRSEQLFKLLYKRKKLTILYDFLSSQPEKAEEYLKYNIEEMKRGILSGGFIPSSSSVFHNLSESLSKECDCDLIKIYKEFLVKITEDKIPIVHK